MYREVALQPGETLSLLHAHPLPVSQALSGKDVFHGDHSSWLVNRRSSAQMARRTCFRLGVRHPASSTNLQWSSWEPLWQASVGEVPPSVEVSPSSEGRDFLLPDLPLRGACSGDAGRLASVQPLRFKDGEREGATFRLAHSLKGPGGHVRSLPRGTGHAPTLRIELQCPIWLVNATGLPLQVLQDSQASVPLAAGAEQGSSVAPTPHGESVLATQCVPVEPSCEAVRLRLRVGDSSDWSAPFTAMPGLQEQQRQPLLLNPVHVSVGGASREAPNTITGSGRAHYSLVVSMAAAPRLGTAAHERCTADGNPPDMSVTAHNSIILTVSPHFIIVNDLPDHVNDMSDHGEFDQVMLQVSPGAKAVPPGANPGTASAATFEPEGSLHVAAQYANTDASLKAGTVVKNGTAVGLTTCPPPLILSLPSGARSPIHLDLLPEDGGEAPNNQCRVCLRLVRFRRRGAHEPLREVEPITHWSGVIELGKGPVHSTTPLRLVRVGTASDGAAELPVRVTQHQHRETGSWLVSVAAEPDVPSPVGVAGPLPTPACARSCRFRVDNNSTEIFELSQHGAAYGPAGSARPRLVVRPMSSVVFAWDEPSVTTGLFSKNGQEPCCVMEVRLPGCVWRHFNLKLSAQ